MTEGHHRVKMLASRPPRGRAEEKISSEERARDQIWTPQNQASEATNKHAEVGFANSLVNSQAIEINN